MSGKISLDYFVSKSIKKHKDAYDYSKFIYINQRTKGIIICPKHGEFYQIPGNHLQGQGCPKCKIDKTRLTLDIFITKAMLVHGDKYDYSKFEYKNSKLKSTIICSEHGEFFQIPNSHLNGAGCPKCGGTQMLRNFSLLASKTHDNFYNYSKFIYINSKTKGTITCPDHGDFEQTPDGHLRKQGCPKCGGKSKSNFKEFIIKAKNAHQDKYDYSKFIYKTSVTGGTIVCKEHGDFTQVPSSHLQGQGCPKCGGSRRLTTEEFINKAIEVHGDTYSYFKVDYINNITKVMIICRSHGDFWQTPSNHLNGSKCPSCSVLDPKWQQEVRGYISNIYFDTVRYNDRTTIKHPVTNRFRELDIYLPEIKIAFECQGTYFHDEKYFPGVTSRDLQKQQLCLEAGITLICIWEYEWSNLESQLLIKDQIYGIIRTKRLT